MLKIVFLVLVVLSATQTTAKSLGVICNIDVDLTCPVSVRKSNECRPDCDLTLADVSRMLKPHIKETLQCLNGGFYEAEVNICRCANGFSGATCDTYLGVCATKECFNGGHCDNKDGTCVCLGGFTGQTCEQRTFCPSANFVWSETGCTCKAGYAGKTCEICDPDILCLPELSSESSYKYRTVKISDAKVAKFLLSSPATPKTKTLKPFKPTPDSNQCACNPIHSEQANSANRQSKKDKSFQLIEGIVSRHSESHHGNDEPDLQYASIYLHHLIEHHHLSHDDVTPWYITISVIFFVLLSVVTCVSCISPRGFLRQAFFNSSNSYSLLPGGNYSSSPQSPSKNSKSPKKTKTPKSMNSSKPPRLD